MPNVTSLAWNQRSTQPKWGTAPLQATPVFINPLSKCNSSTGRRFCLAKLCFLVGVQVHSQKHKKHYVCWYCDLHSFRNSSVSHIFPSCEIAKNTLSRPLSRKRLAPLTGAQTNHLECFVLASRLPSSKSSTGSEMPTDEHAGKK